MKKQEVIVTDSGKLLVDKEDGFVHCGVLFKGDGQGGLLGDAHLSEALSQMAGQEHWHAYTVYEFFDALCLDPDIFLRYYKSKQPLTRGMAG